MKDWIYIGGIVGIINSILLIIYSISTTKGNTRSNKIFALIIICFTLLFIMTILTCFLNNLQVLNTIGISGFLAAGPLYFIFITTHIDHKYSFKKIDLVHFIISLLAICLILSLIIYRAYEIIWHSLNRLGFFQFILYVFLSSSILIHKGDCIDKIRKQLYIFSILLLTIWLVYLMNEKPGFQEVIGAIIYNILIYSSLIIVLKKGCFLNNTNIKYKKVV